ncbi:MAG: hypothetical protein ACLUUJ_01305 [Acutalibacteraceae bacterium]
MQPDDMPAILQAKDRRVAGPTAPACGLYLNRVFYDPADLVLPTGQTLEAGKE